VESSRLSEGKTPGLGSDTTDIVVVVEKKGEKDSYGERDKDPFDGKVVKFHEPSLAT